MQKHEVPYDVIGQSFYPWWHGRMEDLRDNLRRTATTFDRDIFIVETAYPYRPMSMRGAYKAENMPHPMSREGQKAFLIDLVAMVRETPNGRGLGVLWWYPESIPVRGLFIWHGGATALFDRDGNALPALRAFGVDTRP
jgi:arabinogalactan endo-1,4-beta-galactosidase